MSLVIRIYYNAVYGALGGLLGWMLYGIFGDKNAEGCVGAFGICIMEAQTLQMFLGGTLLGGAVGFLVVSVEAIRDGAVIRIARLASYGVVLGAIGGALGMVIGDWLNYFVTSLFVNAPPWLAVVVAMLSRGLGWTVLGVAIGISEGIAARSLGKFSYGAVGGALGGFIGGCLFGLIYHVKLNAQLDSSYWASALGLVILGACIGSLSALVQGVFQPASVRVLRGWQEGREYPLDKQASLLGRDEHADIALFRDMRVEKKHAYIKRQGERYVLVNNGAPPQNTLVNDKPVPLSLELHDGDRIQLGKVLLRFQARAAVNRPKRVRPLPTATLATARRR